MKNPLKKRILRELLSDPGKYLVIFLFMTATIGFVSGYVCGLPVYFKCAGCNRRGG